jgi:hypothetical protein
VESHADDSLPYPKKMIKFMALKRDIYLLVRYIMSECTKAWRFIDFRRLSFRGAVRGICGSDRQLDSYLDR